MGPGQKFLLLGSRRVSHLWFGYGFGNFPLKMSNFLVFCPSGQKKCHCVGSKSTQVRARSASYLLWVKGMFGSGRVSAHLLLEPLSNKLPTRFLKFCLGVEILVFSQTPRRKKLRKKLLWSIPSIRKPFLLNFYSIHILFIH